jgi:nitrogen regulatory protein P-II 1
MKMILAMIRPFKLDEVKASLSEIGVQGMSVSEIKGYGRTLGKSEVFRGSAYTVEFVPKIRIEVVVPDELVEQVLVALETTGKTGKIGDGKIFVYSIENAVRIRTGERGEPAI